MHEESGSIPEQNLWSWFDSTKMSNIDAKTSYPGESAKSTQHLRICAKKNTAMKLPVEYGDGTNERSCKRRFGKKIGMTRKRLLLVKCCLGSKLSFDDFPEEEIATTASSSLSTVLGHAVTSSATKMRFTEIPGPFQGDDITSVSSCKCIRRGLEPNFLKIENIRIHAKSQEQILHKRNGSYIYSPLDAIEPRSRSHSRQTFASSRNNTFSRSSSLSEWHIPYEDIMLEEMVARSMKGPVYRGRWHGEVMVHRISKTKKDDFLREVSLLNLIRHENIILFMGASFEGPDFAIITSLVKGFSLYTHIHEKKTMFELYFKLSIAIQIAQGMEYLHAKKIELGKLCSRNVYLESKVKIAMTDYISRHIPVVNQRYGYIPDRQIMYFSPELMKSLRIKENTLLSERSATLAGDVFAYGTILYEIFLEVYPYAEEHLEIVIWNFSCGRRLNALDDIPIAVGRELFELCWDHEASRRPAFQEILETLRKQGKRRLKRQHSISQPSVIDLSLASSVMQFMEKSGND
ncbi:kinase suppressor of Ras 2-like [Rhopilema esculentum]|uniref:kinase suppressor of Ras 2-like n=1 Tax=Rhopilema esculentum TaxID=499914 RepID=UPI0031D28166